MLRLGIGAGIVVVTVLAFFGWLKKHDDQIYNRARVEIARALQRDAAEKERQAIAAEDSIPPTPSTPEALAKLCKADLDCRDKDTIK